MCGPKFANNYYLNMSFHHDKISRESSPVSQKRQGNQSKHAKFIPRVATPILNDLAGSRGFSTARAYNATPAGSRAFQTRLQATFYELQSRLEAFKSRKLTSLDSLLKKQS